MCIVSDRLLYIRKCRHDANDVLEVPARIVVRWLKPHESLHTREIFEQGRYAMSELQRRYDVCVHHRCDRMQDLRGGVLYKRRRRKDAFGVLAVCGRVGVRRQQCREPVRCRQQVQRPWICVVYSVRAWIPNQWRGSKLSHGVHWMPCGPFLRRHQCSRSLRGWPLQWSRKCAM